MSGMMTMSEGLSEYERLLLIENLRDLRGRIGNDANEQLATAIGSLIWSIGGGDE